MKVVYPVILSKTGDANDTYLVEIPDLQGYTEGHGLVDAIDMARDYIGGYCYDKDPDALPAASDPSGLDLSERIFSDMPSMVSMIDADLDAYRRKLDSRSVRKNVSIPFWLAEAASAQGINFSRTLQDALAQKLNMA